MYNSHKYWNERIEPNGHNNITDLDLKYLPDFLKNSDNILDFGCGIGRVFKLYEGKKVTGIDFSSLYKERAIDSSKKFNLNFNHIVHNVHESSLPIKDDEFDKGIMVAVTLHANNNEVKTILKEVGRVSKEVLLMSLYDSVKLNGLETNQNGYGPHVFNHDYTKIIKDLGFIISYNNTLGNQIIVKYHK